MRHEVDISPDEYLGKVVEFAGSYRFCQIMLICCSEQSADTKTHLNLADDVCCSIVLESPKICKLG